MISREKSCDSIRLTPKRLESWLFEGKVYMHAQYSVGYVFNQGLAIYRWTELQWNVDFVKGHTVGYPWHFKSNEDIITKFKWHGLQIIRINRKKNWWEWHHSFLLSRPHEHDHIWPFFTIQRQGLGQTINLIFILKVLRCSNNLMQKMTSITPSIYKTIHQKVIFKNFDQKFWPLWRI